MKKIIERELSGLTDFEITRLREMLLDEENTYRIREKTGLSLCVIGMLRSQFPTFLRMTQPKKAELRLVHFKAA